MAEKAFNKEPKGWVTLPDDIKRMILDNAYCTQCRKAVTISNYSVISEGRDAVLSGFCSVCGHKVARVAEDCGGPVDFNKESFAKPKRQVFKTSKPKNAPEHYIFDVWIIGKGGICDIKEKVLRKIQISGGKTLYTFAKVITKSFGFYFDHCFGFYDNFQKYHDSKMSYELFVDIGESQLTPTTQGVEKTKIRQVFRTPGEKWLFLFDYGDGWYFTVELKEIKAAEKGDLKPLVLESVGNALPQYPPCEGEEYDEA